MVRVAVIQFEPRLADPAHNLDAIEHHLFAAADAGAELAVFPECSVSGYVYESREEAREVAEPLSGWTTDRLMACTARLGIFAIVGMLERQDDRLYNTAILCGPNGLEAIYRKTHVLCLGVDRFVTPGNAPYRAHTLPFGRVGILICYDLRFPEPARVLSLGGAQILALPTNWPHASHLHPDVFTRARAAESRVWVLAADRVGEEGGVRFLGRSQIVDPDGSVLAEASGDRVEMLVRDIDLAAADRKKTIVRPGSHEWDIFADRRPELYDPILEPGTCPSRSSSIEV